ncbi:probable serine/threonine-protein kinase abkC [Durio zibethinus]|uniref:Probable serine/threonine-protein kinase abkC n=1 Tax=Durio zibethinus TaxID=66656 RepID=A0A6P5ZNK6_DURZI|nr:probable serine/threonine-protein kinase abkC [Durio zibethinus]
METCLTLCRFLGYGNVRRVARSLHSNWKPSFQEANNIVVRTKVEFPYSLYKLCSQYKHSLREDTPFAFYKIKEGLSKSYPPRSFHTLSSSYVFSDNAQVTWKRLFQLFYYDGPALTPISRIACAVTLALSRSNLVVSAFMAFMIGELAWTQQKWAEAGDFSAKDTLYMQAQNGRIYLASFVLFLWEFIILLFRAIYLAILFLPSIAMAPFVDSLGVEFRKMWLRVVHRTLEKAGPAFIKWGQWVAIRPDLFPRDLCDVLVQLQATAPSHSFSFTKKSIEKAFGQKLTEIFANFEEEPLASGSIAQVHRATLKYRYPGQQTKPIVVAVKVRHPGVSEAIRRDFMIINFVAKLSKFIPTLKWLRLDESLQQFAVYMMSQVDLAREAAHLSRFIYNFRRWKDVSFPEPLYPLVHPAVLVETFEHGESVLHYVDELEGHEQTKNALAHIGTHAFLKMLLVDNFIHADLHPGNILVRVKDRRSCKHLFSSRPHVIFLDVGMTAELSKIDRMNLLEFFKAIALRDGRSAAESTLRLSKQQHCPNPKAFIEDVEQSFNFWDSPDGEFVYPGECIQQLLEHVRRHNVNIDGNVCTVIITTLVLEGWQRKLDPQLDVMRMLQTVLFKVDRAKSLLYTIEGLMAP